jgi:hypothetical protein
VRLVVVAFGWISTWLILDKMSWVSNSAAAKLASGLTADPFTGPIEIWTKWKSDSLSLDSMNRAVIQKQRWLRKFDTSGPRVTEIALDATEQVMGGDNPPARGCNVELTFLTVDDINWWTLGFESFGALVTVEHDLRAATSVWNRGMPPLAEWGLLANYPTWLRNSCLGAGDSKG